MGGVWGGEEKKAAFRGNENSGLFQLFHPLPLSHLERSTKAVWNKKNTPTQIVRSASSPPPP